jgi:transcription elongation factor Elf1
MRGKHLKDSGLNPPKTNLKQVFWVFLMICLLLLSSLFYMGSSTVASRSRTKEEEPNNSLATAMVADNGSYNGSVDSTDKWDYYNISLGGGHNLAVIYSTSAFGDRTALVLFDDTREELWNSSWVPHDATIYLNYTMNRTTGGNYYLGILSENTGNDYDLIISIKPQNDAKTKSDAGDIISKATEHPGGTISGFLGGLDVYDFYKFMVPAGGIFDVNMSVSTKFSGAIKFEIYNDQHKVVKSTPFVNPGSYQIHQYTINGSSAREFFISAGLNAGRNEYNLSLELTNQDDGTSGGDAGDVLTAAVELIEQSVPYSGWLGAGNMGRDRFDVYHLPVPQKSETQNANISVYPKGILDLIVKVYNDTFEVISTKNPNAGQQIYVNLVVNQEKDLYVELQVDPGKHTAGEYIISYSISIKGADDKDSDSDGMPDTWELKYGLNPDIATDADLDLDSDKLKNLAEFKNDTNPTKVDTDSDKMPDGWEVDFGLDPKTDDAANDPDGDGFSNLKEYQNHTDPTDLVSKPLKGYDHLTVESSRRSYTDARSDVWLGTGTIDSVTDEQTINELNYGDHPQYDAVTLTSKRLENKLIVKLKLNGKVHDISDLGDESRAESRIGTRADEITDITYYWVGFVRPSFTEPEIDQNTGIIDVFFDDENIEFPLIYINKTFIGTPGTNGQKTDSGQALEWHIPLAEIAELKADFELYALVSHIKLTTQDTQETFEMHYDSIGTGSIELISPDVTINMNKHVTIDGRKVGVWIKADRTGASINIDKVDRPKEAPANVGDLGVYVDIELTGGAEAKEIFLTIHYNNSDIPSDFKEKDIKIFYYNQTREEWVKLANSGVWTNNNTAWARPTHLTIFAPMAKPGDGDGDSEDDGWIWIVIIAIIIIIIIIVISLVIIRQRKRARRPAPREPPRPQRALTPEFFPCPRCEEEIEILYAETEQVGLKCPSCGAKGKIDNPYLRRGDKGYGDRRRREGRGRGKERDEDYDRDQDYDRDRERDRDYHPDYDRDYERDRDHEHEPHKRKPSSPKIVREVETDDEDYEYKNCPKCDARIAIPYEEAEKILLECPNCGAQGKVKNPYI